LTLVVERVADAETMRQWLEVQAACDGRTHERIKEARLRFAAQRGFDPADRQQTYLARLGGAPVGGAILHVAAGAAGVYQVATLPEARRRGVARAPTLRALVEGRARGCRLGVLHATPMAESLYRSIGFVDRPPAKIFVDLPSPR
jgi:GNAT superfamily N-acetyltransferase